MKKILIVSTSAVGHIMRTFKIAKALKTHGHQVVYMVDETSKKIVESQGFETLICNPVLFVNFEMLGIFEQDRIKPFERLLNRLTNITLKTTINNLKKFETVIEQFNPDLIIMDVFLTCNYILQKFKRPTVFFETKVSTYQDKQVPPLNSRNQPTNSFQIRLEWLKYKLSRQLTSISQFGEGSWGLTKRALNKLHRQVNFEQLTWDKCFYVGLKNVPELVLSPIEFDFPRKQKQNFQYYVWPTVDLDRGETLSDVYQNLMKRIGEKKIAYCSLGTLSVIHNKNSAAFLKLIAQVFQKKDDWELIISCGQTDANKLGIIGSNIHLFQSIPQLDMIKRSDLVITHGGMNSILECILLGSPMLVFPLNKNWDQEGNAARVIYHKLGLAGNIDGVTEQKLTQMIQEVTQNAVYQNRISEMSKILQRHNDNLREAIAFIEKQMSVEL